MDVPREPQPRRRRLVAYGVAGLGVLAALVALGRLKPAAMTVERTSLLIDEVKRGPMVFQVRGTGTLVPVDVKILTAPTGCKVERVLILPGSAVKEDSVIAELSSPELQQAAEEAAWALRKAQSEHELGALNQKGSTASAKAALLEAQAALRASDRLRKEGLLSESDLLKAQVRLEEAQARADLERARLDLYEGRGGSASPSRAAMEQARAQAALKQAQVAALKVRPGMAGILQQLPLQVGQQLAAGALLAKVAKPLPLKAELKVSETQAKDLQIGQKVTIDTRNGLVDGRVLRIDPAVQNGTVSVDASLEGELPKGVRPDLSVEGVIELDRADSGLFVGRPVQAQAHAQATLFKLSPDGTEAVRVKVRFGRGSVNTLEIVEGLQPGDKVVLSDATPFDGQDRIRIK